METANVCFETEWNGGICLEHPSRCLSRLAIFLMRRLSNPFLTQMSLKFISNFGRIRCKKLRLISSSKFTRACFLFQFRLCLGCELASFSRDHGALEEEAFIGGRQQLTFGFSFFLFHTDFSLDTAGVLHFMNMNRSLVGPTVPAKDPRTSRKSDSHSSDGHPLLASLISMTSIQT